MSKDDTARGNTAPDSPNSLEVKTSPRQGFLGGGVSRKLIGLTGISLFVIVMLILYVISQKGRHTEKAKEDAPVAEQGSQDNAGLEDILNAAPAGAAVSPAEKKSASGKPARAGNAHDNNARTSDGSGKTESEETRRARVAYEQEAEQIRLHKAQQFQAALSAKSDISIDLKDDDEQGSTSPAQDGAGRVPVTGAGTPEQGGGAEGDPNKQNVKMAFAKESHSNTYLQKGKEAPLSPYELKVGTLIPATMISGLNSDLPGQIIASVSQNVYDSATGSHLLLPQGAELYGLYDSQVAYGQDRILVAWTRVNFPDGSTLELKGMGAIDAGGYAGFEDQVDHHYWKIFGNAFVLGMITGATEAGISDDNSDDNSTAESVNNGVAEQFAETGSTLIEKNLDVQPTITIRNGYRFNIMLNKDVILEPYQPIE